VHRVRMRIVESTELAQLRNDITVKVELLFHECGQKLLRNGRSDFRVVLVGNVRAGVAFFLARTSHHR